MKETYFFKLYRYDKKWFCVVAIFAGLTLLCNLRGNEVTPFFVWGMYSEKMKPQKDYLVFKTTVNDTLFVDTYSGYSDNTRMFLNAPLAYYIKR
jgi:predicted small integral membrane protein